MDITNFELETIYYFILFFIAILAAFIDSIVGGGGLITLPALMASGIPSHLALSTNKLQSVFGSFTASASYFKSRSMPHLAWGVFFTGLGAGLGAYTVLLINDKHLKLIILILLTITFLYTVLKPSLGKKASKPKMKNIKLFHILCGTSIGFYDGFLGPGTGSFLIFACVLLLGYDMKRASINTKILNFSSNVVSLAVFLWHYEVMFLLGVVMGCGQIIGAFFGAKLVLKTNTKFIKILFIVVVGATIAKVSYDYFKSFF
ncbi:MAG TPA: TSUP family transporter [Campylobacter avium]|uniref:TSUP family transporter n=1 Tax=Campylobacter avium TaxID=522485 RepID=UPI001DE232CB|nr:TSUP family transporter [Campylobacter avium]HJE65672.1 TSUP family transporter [Campylobacter avium]